MEAHKILQVLDFPVHFLETFFIKFSGKISQTVNHIEEKMSQFPEFESEQIWMTSSHQAHPKQWPEQNLGVFKR